MSLNITTNEIDGIPVLALITGTDSGNSQLNYSEIVGSAMAAGISTYAYHPHADKTLSNTASVWGTQLG
jgi:hypothetical protein